jgi:hypothetical protein
MRQHALDLAQLGRLREQVLRDVEGELAADHHRRVGQPVEGHVDSPLRRVLDGDHPVLGPAPLHLVEDLRDGADRAEVRRRPEVLQRRLVSEGGGGAKVGDRERFLEGAAAREDLRPDRAHRVGRQRSRVPGEKSAEDFGLALRDIRRRTLPSFEVSYAEGGLGALVEEVEDLVV